MAVQVEGLNLEQIANGEQLSKLEASQGGRELGDTVYSKIGFTPSEKRVYGAFMSDSEQKRDFDMQLVNQFQIKLQEELGAKGMSIVDANQKAFAISQAYKTMYYALNEAGIGLENTSGGDHSQIIDSNASDAGRELGDTVYSKIGFTPSEKRAYGSFMSDSEQKRDFDMQLVNQFQVKLQGELGAKGMSIVDANQKAFAISQAYKTMYHALNDAGIGLTPPVK